MNINVRAAFIHVLGDLIQSVGVVVASVIIKFKVISVLSARIISFLIHVLIV